VLSTRRVAYEEVAGTLLGWYAYCRAGFHDGSGGAATAVGMVSSIEGLPSLDAETERFFKLILGTTGRDIFRRKGR
jgi:hypothetical protein